MWGATVGATHGQWWPGEAPLLLCGYHHFTAGVTPHDVSKLPTGFGAEVALRSRQLLV